MLLLRIISWLPLGVLYVISDILFFISFYLVRYRKKMVWKNLKNSFPDKDDNTLKKIQKEFYRSLCDYGVETLKLLTIKKEALSVRMVFKDRRIIDFYRQQGQSILFLASHQFNWEWLLVSSSFALNMPVDFIYQPQNSTVFNEFSLACRTRFGAYAIKREEVAREVVKRRNIFRGIASVADQYPGLGKDKKYQTLFLNQETVFFYGTNQLITLTQFPTIFIDIRKIKRGYYEAYATEVARPPYAKDSNIIENYVRKLEIAILENPSNWLWSHNRWKKRHLTPTSTQYPHESIAS